MVESMSDKNRKIAVIVILSLVFILAGFIVFATVKVSKDYKKNKGKQTMGTDNPVAGNESSSSGGKESSSSGKESSSSGGKKESSGKGKGGDENADSDWTLLFYVCGTDLEYVKGGRDIAYASLMFSEMGKADISDKINVIVETGGTRQWRNDEFKGNIWSKIDIPEDKLGRFRVTDDEVEVLESAELASMGEASTLSDFIRWGTENYPAKHYMLVFWDHGYEMPYGCIECDTLFYKDDDGKFYNYYDNKSKVDDGSLKNDCLVMSELRQALEDGGIHFDIMGFETCVTASIEFAAAIADYADYMVASEESAPAIGWSHKEVLNYLSENTNCDVTDLGKTICNSFIKKGENASEKTGMDAYDAENIFSRSTMSMIDLSCMDELMENFSELTKYMYYSTYDMESFTAFQRASQDTEHFGSDTYGVPALVDLGNYVENISDFMNDSEADDNIAKIIKDNIYSVQGVARSKTTGLMFYCPDTGFVSGFEKYYKTNYPGESDSTYKRAVRMQMAATLDPYVENISYMPEYYWYASYLDKKMGDYWETDVEIVYEAQEKASSDVEPETAISSEEYVLDGAATINKDDKLELNITKGLDGLVRVDMFVIVAINYEGSTVVMELGETGDIQADFENGKFLDGFDGTWFTFNDNVLPAYITEETSERDIYSFPARVNGETVNVLFSYEKADGTYKILYAYVPSDESGVASKDFRELKDGDEIEPLYTILIEGEGYEKRTLGAAKYDSKKQMINKEQVVDSSGDEMYIYYFTLYDAFGESYHSDCAFLSFEDGEQKLTEYSYDKIMEDIQSLAN